MNDIQLSDSINNQKAVAKDILTKLEALDPHCILAGGAPRNWFLGKEANDLDFYIHNVQTVNGLMTQLAAVNLDAKMVDFKSDAWREYGIMTHLLRILEVDYKGMKVQIMCMRESTFHSVIPSFGVSICKFWWKGDEVIPTNEALVSILEETLYVKDDYSAKELHVDKMVKYFPTYKIKSSLEYDRPDLRLHTYSGWYSPELYNIVIIKLKEKK